VEIVPLVAPVGTGIAVLALGLQESLVGETVELVNGYAAVGARVPVMALVTLEASVTTALLDLTAGTGAVTFRTAKVTGLASVASDPTPYAATDSPGISGNLEFVVNVCCRWMNLPQRKSLEPQCLDHRYHQWMY
jgi:hypothetical protein